MANETSHSSGPSPLDFIVAVDIGTTGTSISMVNLLNKYPGSAQVEHFTLGEGQYEKEEKIPTTLVYLDKSSEASREPLAWGFKAQTMALEKENIVQASRFKELFTADRTESHRDWLGRDLPAVQTLYMDFLKAVHEFIKNHLIKSHAFDTSRWESLRIEYLFSVPATWNFSYRLEFGQIIHQAGFGAQTNHIVKCDYTEAHGVAVQTLHEYKNKFKSDTNVHVVDLGGWSLDQCIARVFRHEKLDIKLLEEIKPVSGKEIGSLTIDDAFEKMVLEEIKSRDPADFGTKTIQEASHKLVRSQAFQDYKTGLGKSPNANDLLEFRVLDFNPSAAGMRADLKDEAITFTNGDLMKCFDKVISRVQAAINTMVTEDSVRGGVCRIEHIVLSGGLSRSAYVVTRLRDYCAKFHLSNSVELLGEPQRGVSLGMARNRLTELRHKNLGSLKTVNEWSIGVIQVDEKEHRRNTPLTSKIVHWLMRKGETCGDDDNSVPINFAFAGRVSKDQRKCWFYVVRSIVGFDEEQTSWFSAPAMQVILKAHCDFSSISDKEVEMKKFLHIFPRHYEIRCLIAARITPGSIDFTCHPANDQDGKPLNKESNVLSSTLNCPWVKLERL